MRTCAGPTGPSTPSAATTQPRDDKGTADDHNHTGTAGRTGEHGRLGLALILVAAFMVVLDFSIVNVALSSIQRELGVSAASVQWVVTAYAIAFGGLLILGGRAGDLYGRRRLFLAGIGVFTAASLAGGLARDPVLLIAARLVQGSGAAMVAPAALSLITTGFAEGPRRTRALGLYGATASVGFVAGQVLGGVLVEFLSWRSVFLVNVPVGLAAMLLAPRVLRESRSARAGRHLDTSGALLITLAVAALVFAVSQTATTGVDSVAVLAPLALSALAGAVFVANERRHADPLVQPALLRIHGLRNAGTLMLLLGLWNGGEMLVLSVYLQQVLHMSPLEAGLSIAPQGIVGLATGLLGTRLIRHIGIQRVLVVAGTAATAGFAALTRLPTTGGSHLPLAAVMLVGFGTTGMAFGSMVTASAGIADRDQGLVGGVINTSRQLGAAMGAALLPAVADAVDRTRHTSMAIGDRAAMLAGLLAAALATLVALKAWYGTTARCRLIHVTASTLAVGDRSPSGDPGPDAVFGQPGEQFRTGRADEASAGEPGVVRHLGHARARWSEGLGLRVRRELGFRRHQSAQSAGEDIDSEGRHAETGLGECPGRERGQYVVLGRRQTDVRDKPLHAAGPPGPSV
ncbi:MFS transporter [Streptomyces sp. NPDC052107]|uniref:MFS transporter n=1 Tax=Streptomyces sp. NPDC052107 TaxID=3155632 RepID=UPI0034461E6E